MRIGLNTRTPVFVDLSARKKFWAYMGGILGGVRSAAKISALPDVTELTIGLVVVYTKHQVSVRPRTGCSTLALL